MRTGTHNIAFAYTRTRFSPLCKYTIRAHTYSITSTWLCTRGEWQTGQRAPHQFLSFYFAFPKGKRNVRRHSLCRTLSSTSFSSLLAIHHHNHIDSKLSQNIVSRLHLANLFLIGSSTAAALVVVLSMLPFSYVVKVVVVVVVVVVLVHRLSVVASNHFGIVFVTSNCRSECLLRVY